LIFSESLEQAAVLIDGFDHMQADIIPEPSGDDEESED
jgi:hypothetical protein